MYEPIVDVQKLNFATHKDLYPLPYMEEIIDEVIGHKMYLFINYFYHKQEVLCTLLKNNISNTINITPRKFDFKFALTKEMFGV